jgi:Bacterial HORMA domain family 1
MYNTITGTATYTVVDIRKTFEGFESDLRMIARRTGKWTMDYVDKIFHDVIKLAEAKYLSSVSIALMDSSETPIRAAKFIVNLQGNAMTGDRAGGNDWSKIPYTTLTIVLSYNSNWNNLTKEQQNKFQANNDFQIGWIGSRVDTTFSHLSRTVGQLYASNGHELQKQNFQ